MGPWKTAEIDPPDSGLTACHKYQVRMLGGAQTSIYQKHCRTTWLEKNQNHAAMTMMVPMTSVQLLLGTQRLPRVRVVLYVKVHRTIVIESSRERGSFPNVQRVGASKLEYSGQSEDEGCMADVEHSTCRSRKKKCDETKPKCNNCIRGNFECQGYGPRTSAPTKSYKPQPLQSRAAPSQILPAQPPP